MFLSFPWMNNYRNHLVFALEDSHAFDTKRFNLQRFPGMIAGSGFQKPDYRSTYDISLPIISSFQPDAATFSERQYLIAIVQNQFSVSLKSDIDRLLQQPREVNDELPKSIIVHTNDQSEPFLVYRSRDLSCKRISLAYETVLSSSLFCLIDQIQAPNTLLFDAMKAGCIPVILSSDTILPFSEKLDWTKYALSILFTGYSAIAKTTLDIINSRVFPHYAKSYNEWNDPSSSLQEVPSEVSFPSNGDAICNGYALIVATKSHIKYLVPLLSRISQSRYMQEAYIIWLGEPDSLASSVFLLLSNVTVHVLPPLYNSKEQSVLRLPETKFSSFLFLTEHALIPADVTAVDFAYEVILLIFHQFFRDSCLKSIAWCQHPNRVVTIPSIQPTKSHSEEASFDLAFFHKKVISLASNVCVILNFTKLMCLRFLKVFVVRLLELLPDKLSGLISSTGSCAEVVLPDMVVRLSGRPPIHVSPEKHNQTPAGVPPDLLESFSVNSSMARLRQECLRLPGVRRLLPNHHKETFTFMVHPY
ncbi:unnamed protein product [Mesocestoides corti]|uniref:Exostosin GT47 domain-containing protein n=1 Tax=Mesocestoides corti TaxID=53468 RepID=A0A0R3UPE5_MESCO|nr:unnamed protein product [Mesocestoides corti]